MTNTRGFLIVISVMLLCGASAMVAASSAAPHGGIVQGVTIVDRDGDDNAITLDKAPNSNAIRVRDAAAEIELSADDASNCTHSSGRQRVHCKLHKAKLLIANIATGAGNDVVKADLRGFPKKDGFVQGSIRTRTGSDLIRGGPRSSLINPGRDNDVARGGRGFDFVIGSPDDGGDRLFGGASIDYLFYGRVNSDVNVDLRRPGYGGPEGEIDWIANFEGVGGANGDDTLVAGNGRNLISGENGADRIRTGAGRDQVVPGNGADHVFTGSGRDRVEGGRDKARDIIKCGPGRDFATVERRDITRGCERVEIDTSITPVPLNGRDRWLPRRALSLERHG